MPRLNLLQLTETDGWAFSPEVTKSKLGALLDWTPHRKKLRWFCWTRPLLSDHKGKTKKHISPKNDERKWATGREQITTEDRMGTKLKEKHHHAHWTLMRDRLHTPDRTNRGVHKQSCGNTHTHTQPQRKHAWVSTVLQDLLPPYDSAAVYLRLVG